MRNPIKKFFTDGAINYASIIQIYLNWGTYVVLINNIKPIFGISFVKFVFELCKSNHMIMIMIILTLNFKHFLFQFFYYVISKMPVHRSADSTGPFYRWGTHGKKYYYVAGNKRSRDIAYEKARKQGMAIHASGWVGK